MNFGVIANIALSVLSNQQVMELLQKLSPQVFGVLKFLGPILFPKVDRKLQAVAAAEFILATERVKKAQIACNQLLELAEGERLVVDGICGEKTRAKVEELQKLIGTDVVDGWPGRDTEVKIDDWTYAKGLPRIVVPRDVS